jgi:magnesium transporter
VVVSGHMGRQIIRHNQSSFRWVDVVSPETGELPELAREFSLHATLLEDCLEPFHLPKYESATEFNRDYSFLMVRVVEEPARPEAFTILELTRKIAIFAGKDFVLTIHRSEMDLIESLKRKWGERLPEYPGNPRDHLLYDLLSRSIETFDREFERSETERDAIELAILDLRPGKYDIRSLYQLKRRASVCRRLLWLMNDAIGRLTRDASEGSRTYASGLRDDLENTLQYSEDLVEGLHQLLGIHHSLESQRSNEVMRVMALFSAFFFPLTLIAGIYGMNFKHMPELDLAWGYPAALVLMGLTSLGVWIWFKRKRWL